MEKPREIVVTRTLDAKVLSNEELAPFLSKLHGVEDEQLLLLYCSTPRWTQRRNIMAYRYKDVFVGITTCRVFQMKIMNQCITDFHFTFRKDVEDFSAEKACYLSFLPDTID